MRGNDTSKNIYYVYMLGYNEYIPFYIGKGCKNRKDAHVKEAKSGVDGQKHRVINEFLAQRKRICVKILKENLSENEALAYEHLLIKQYAPTRLLTNIVSNRYAFDCHKHHRLLNDAPPFCDDDDLCETEVDIIWKDLDPLVKQAAREAVRATENLFKSRGRSKRTGKRKKKFEGEELERIALAYRESERKARAPGLSELSNLPTPMFWEDAEETNLDTSDHSSTSCYPKIESPIKQDISESDALIESSSQREIRQSYSSPDLSLFSHRKRRKLQAAWDIDNEEIESAI